MKSYPLIATALYMEPWCIRQAVHADFCLQFESLVERGVRLDLQGATDPVGPGWRNSRGEVSYAHPQVEQQNGVAYMLVDGVLGKRLSLFEMQCGGYDINLMEQQLENIRADQSIHSVLIEFNTPGGRAAGLEQAALAIRAVSDAGKHVVGYAEQECCSAGYFLAAACDEFLVHQDAIVGSISTICAAIDRSGEWAQKGWKLELFTTGKNKAVGVQGKAWEESDREFVRAKQQVVDDLFKGFVRQRRGLSDELMDGSHWYARAAPEGIVDGFAKNSVEVLQALLMRK